MKSTRPEWMAPDRLARIFEISNRNRNRETDLPALAQEAEDAVARFPGSAGWELFFTRASDMPRRATLAEQTGPEAVRELLATADRVVAHEFSLLGAGWRSFGFPMPWHDDIRSGYRWDPEPDYHRIPDGLDRLLNTGGGVELKAPWDLSNMHWLMTLTAAWHLRREPRYLRAIENDITDWIAANPPYGGVNWYCAMNIAMHAVSLITCLAAVYPDVDETFLRNTLHSLHLHGPRILSRLEFGKGKTRNNHYFTDLIGLFFLGVLFRDSESGHEWLTFSKAELELEARLQFYPDGVVMEDSTSYHRFSTEILLLCVMLGDSAGVPFSDEVRQGLHRSLSFTRDILQANDTVPQFGDNDNGRMLPIFGYMTRLCSDHRHILALGGEFLHDDSMRRAGAAAASDAVWLLGRFQSPLSAPSSGELRLAAYPESGFYSVRDADASLLIRAGRILGDYGGGHAHSDPLSFTFHFRGRDVIVDAGVHNYSADTVARNAFRSTAYHNTVQLEGRELQEFDPVSIDGLWQMTDRAAAAMTVFEGDGARAIFRGRLDSYTKALGHRVEREIVWDRDTRTLRVTDRTRPAGSATISAVPAVSRFLLSPGWTARVLDPRRIALFDGAEQKAVMTASPGTVLAPGGMGYSPQYGESVPAIQIRAAWTADGKTESTVELILENTRT